jgi:hypothetical protein
MHIGHDFRPFRLAEEGNYGDDNQQRFQPFAQQDDRRA